MSLVSFTDADGGAVTLDAGMIACVMEANAMSKARGCPGFVAVKIPINGCVAFSARETHDEITARWRAALGLKEQMN